MKGTIKILLEQMIADFSHGDPLSRRLIETKLYLRGIHVNQYKEDTPDDPMIIERIRMVESELRKIYI